MMAALKELSLWLAIKEFWNRMPGFPSLSFLYKRKMKIKE
jgi:hypothetical protein